MNGHNQRHPADLLARGSGKTQTGAHPDTDAWGGVVHSTATGRSMRLYADLRNQPTSAPVTDMVVDGHARNAQMTSWHWSMNTVTECDARTCEPELPGMARERALHVGKIQTVLPILAY